jgi:hypothetical protein
MSGASGGLAPGMKSDLFLWWNWGLQHLTKGGENGVEFGVVALLHFHDLAPQIFVRGEHGADLEEGAHDGDVHLNGAIAVEDAGEHRHTLLGEGVGSIPAAAAAVLF